MLWPALASRAFRPLVHSRVVTSSAIAQALPHVPIPVEKAVDSVAESSTTLPTLLTRPSKASFAAAQAIRMCIGNGGISDGFFVFNSLRWAAHRQKNSALPFKMPGITESKSEFEAAALRFGPNVPTRLSAHTLLHGLIRHNLAQPAFELSKLMMQEGITLRSATLEAIMQILLAPKVPFKMIPLSRRTIPVKTASDALLLHPSRMSDPGTRFALELLFLARRHRQRRTDNMFKLFMAASLLNGELIIVSLLFGWTCRDWQTGYSLASNLAGVPEDDDELRSSTQVAAARLRLDHLRREAIYPHRYSMERALQAINDILARDRDPTSPTQDRLVALQALANIAGLLERHQIPFTRVSALVRTLYRCPRVDDEVWIVGLGGCPERIKAHTYFHRVLSHLLQTFPTERLLLRQPSVPRSAIVENRRYDVLPPLDLNSCNTLLHYALRHRLSPEFADKILRHMATNQGNNNSPDIVTANVLLRSGALLHRDDIVTDTLKSMGSLIFTPDIPFTTTTGESQEMVDISMAPALSGPRRSPFGFIRDARESGAQFGRVQYGRLYIPELPSAADLYTLTSYIAYLTAIGKPREVTDILFAILPELDNTQFPTNSELEADRRLGRTAVIASLRRAITLGPFFFTTVLNSLTKSGQFALADRVWQLAKKAEWCSWMRTHVPDCEPWIFGPPVYTVMMQCYGTLARRREPWRLQLHPQKRISLRTSQNSAWAYFIYTCQKLPSPLPRGRVLMLLRQIMAHASFGVFQRLMQLRTEYQRLPKHLQWLPESELPRPDARFFNAALDVFRPRAAAPGAEPWFNALQEAQQAFDETGVVLPNEDWNVPLQAVVEAMVRAGFPLPLSMRSISVGRLRGVEKDSTPTPNPTSPLGFGEYKDVLQPLHLASPKQKALPISDAYDHYRQLRVRRWLQRQQRRSPARWQKKSRVLNH
ncbi:hypothetical protein C8F01DRAFT_1016781 [Mycena amicta]|nr:hypothetical protein C8F01DRAFT_1016781 [Mycena amicta]